MRYFGTRAVPSIPVMPDTKLSLLLTANSAQAFDYPTGTDLIRFRVGSTAASLAGLVFADLATTNAALPTTGGIISSMGSSGGIALSGNYEAMYMRPRASTGFSLIAGSSFSITVEFWSRTGNTTT